MLLPFLAQAQSKNNEQTKPFSAILFATTTTGIIWLLAHYMLGFLG